MNTDTCGLFSFPDDNLRPAVSVSTAPAHDISPQLESLQPAISSTAHSLFSYNSFSPQMLSFYPNVERSANSLAFSGHTSLAPHWQMIDVPPSIPHSIHGASLFHDFFHSASEGSSTSTVYGPKLTPNSSEEVMVLDKFKKQIFSSLQPSDLSVFIRHVREAGLVHQQVKDDLDIMHPSVPHETKYRYLIVHICLEIKCSARKDRINSLNELCKVLDSFPTLAHIGKLIDNEIVVIIKRRNEAGDNATNDNF